MDERLFINQYLSILSHPFCADIHFLTGGIVEEFHLGLAILVCLDVRIPIDGATEVLLWWEFSRIVGDIKSCRLVASHQIDVASLDKAFPILRVFLKVDVANPITSAGALKPLEMPRPRRQGF